MLQSVAKAMLARRGPVVQSVRTCYPYYHRLVVVPPRTRYPGGFAEVVFWGCFMVTGILATPAWILLHLHEYKGKKKGDPTNNHDGEYERLTGQS